MLTDRTTHGIALQRTAAGLYMAIGSEWPEARLLIGVGKPGNQKLRKWPSVHRLRAPVWRWPEAGSSEASVP
ncbi:hypothetical protein BX257_9214 [Streptomyces sp. 3212.3]|nr:hypothetical protein BX257_9214 [Streptomyces sp. 3212.3]